MTLTASRPLPYPALAPQVEQLLSEFLRSAQSSFHAQLKSVVLFGSAAEGKLRPTSDVNLMLILSAFEQQSADQLREPFRLAHAAIHLRAMFLLSEEIPAAVSSFAPKFADILRRRVILFGEDPFALISISREDEIRQLKQLLLNITLRLRAAYVVRSVREEQLAYFIAASIGPLRASASALLELEGRPAPSPHQAFEHLGASLSLSGWGDFLRTIDSIQDAHLAQPGNVRRLFFRLLEFTQFTMARVDALQRGAR